MARTSDQVSKAELDAFRAWFAKNPQYDTAANGEAISHYLLEVWAVDVTEYTLGVAAQKLQEAGTLEVLSPATVRYALVARQDLGRAEALHNWYLDQKILVVDGTDADGDQALENQTALLTELQGRDITSRSIQEAIGRLAYKQGLHFAPAPPQKDPRQHQDDGKGFMPKDETNRRYVGGRKNHGQDPQPSATTPAPDKEPDAWETLCTRMLKHGTHGCQQAMAEAFNRRGTKPWRLLYAEMQQIKESYEHLVSYRY